TTMSNGSKRRTSEAAIRLLVGLVRPFGEGGERIVRLVYGRLVQQHARVGDAIAQRVAGLEAELLAHLTWDHGLAFDRNLGERGGRSGLSVHAIQDSLPSYVLQWRRSFLPPAASADEQPSIAQANSSQDLFWMF